jgi:hypothetical protein
MLRWDDGRLFAVSVPSGEPEDPRPSASGLRLCVEREGVGEAAVALHLEVHDRAVAPIEADGHLGSIHDTAGTVLADSAGGV